MAKLLESSKSARNHQAFELMDLVASAKSDSEFDINRDMDIAEIIVVGHSRGALVVYYNADNKVLISSESRSVRVVLIEFPVSSWLTIRNPDYIEYIKFS